MDRSRLQRFFNCPVGELALVNPPLVTPETPVRDAVAAMVEGAQSCVLAVNDGEVVGIFTERDVLTKCMEQGFDWAQPLGNVLAGQPPLTILRTRPVGEAVALMRKHRYRTLPVVDESRKLVGLLRLQELLHHLAEEYPEEVLNIPPRPHQVMETREGG